MESESKTSIILGFNVINYGWMVIYKIELTYMDDFVYKYRSFLIFLHMYCKFNQNENY